NGCGRWLGQTIEPPTEHVLLELVITVLRWPTFQFCGSRSSGIWRDRWILGQGRGERRRFRSREVNDALDDLRPRAQQEKSAQNQAHRRKRCAGTRPEPRAARHRDLAGAEQQAIAIEGFDARRQGSQSGFQTLQL